MHGEYKMPGGKLVVADLAVEGGRLAHVQISGDFFLEPDSALDAINRALTGRAVPAQTAELTHALDAALGADVVMYGISSEAIAVAVLRALEAQ
ncbi:MAG: biotin--protein ligase [Burkholderiaceae bacterium]|jgi:lipoate-protein ligase A|nr:MAG: biotin--protein ligase [Burkholderiaceae bacterium]